MEKQKEGFRFSEKPNLEEIRQIHDNFSRERDWGQYHTPRNLTLALVGEVGELAEIFQWKGEVAEGLPEFTSKDRKALEEELSDILIYLVRLADKCHVDLPSAVLKKIELNRLKYPVEKAIGSSRKYTEYLKSDTNELTNGTAPYNPLASLQKQVADLEAFNLNVESDHQYTSGRCQKSVKSDEEKIGSLDGVLQKLDGLDIKSSEN